MKILVLGAGMMARAAAFDLARASAIDRVYLADPDLRRAENAAALAQSDKIEPLTLDVADRSILQRAMKMAGTTLATGADEMKVALTHAAIESGSHLCVLSARRMVVLEQRKLHDQAQRRGVTIIPHCGIASLLAAHALESMGAAETLEIRAGAVPRQPEPPLFLQLSTTAKSLLDAYVEPAFVVREGKLCQEAPMSELEEVELAPPVARLEAFHTSAGLPTLPESFAGRIDNMNEKILCHRGHRERMKAMLDLGLADEQPVELPGGKRVRPREVFETVLERALSRDDADVALVHVILARSTGGSPRRIVQQIVDEQDRTTGHTAAMRVNGYPAAIIAHMLASGLIEKRGVWAPELCVPLAPFFDSIAGRGIRIERTQA